MKEKTGFFLMALAWIAADQLTKLLITSRLALNETKMCIRDSPCIIPDGGGITISLWSCFWIFWIIPLFTAGKMFCGRFARWAAPPLWSTLWPAFMSKAGITSPA